MRRVITSSALAIGLMLVLTAPASAISPQRESDTFPFQGTADCGAFSDDYSGSASVRSTTFFDAEGAIGARLKVLSRETDTNSMTGKSVRVNGSYTVTIDFLTGIRRTAGLVYMGVGGKDAHIIHDAGLVLFNDDTGEVLKVAGVHAVLDGGDAPFCQALS